MKFEAMANQIAKPFEGLVPQMGGSIRKRKVNSPAIAFAPHDASAVQNLRWRALKPEILAVHPYGSVSLAKGMTRRSQPDGRPLELNIHQFSELTTEAAVKYIANLSLSEQQRIIVSDVLHEIESRLQFLVEVGLGYLTLNRESGTLSGGEAQRIRLATQIGSGLAGVLYVLDEPSIGLNQRDNARLLTTLRRPAGISAIRSSSWSR